MRVHKKLNNTSDKAHINDERLLATAKGIKTKVHVGSVHCHLFSSM